MDCCTENIDIRQPFAPPAPYAAPGDQYQYDIYFIVDQLKRLTCQSEQLRRKVCEQEDGMRHLAQDQMQNNCDIAAVNQRLDSGDFNKGDFEQWTVDNMPQIVADTVKFISFGLTEDGHFVAYVPETWSFLRFDTVQDITSPCFGRLVINY